MDRERRAHCFIRLIAAIFLALCSVNVGSSHAAEPRAVYKQLCSFCHDDGTLRAPIRGDQVAWRERLEAGREALYESALDGMGHMPERRGRKDIYGKRQAFTDQDIKNAVDYLLDALDCRSDVKTKASPKVC